MTAIYQIVNFMLQYAHDGIGNMGVVLAVSEILSVSVFVLVTLSQFHHNISIEPLQKLLARYGGQMSE
jgi:hypothetical protein